MKIIILFSFVLLISSCISNKKILFLQKEDVNQDIATKDSVLRSYNLIQIEYRLQTSDILSVQFQSLTEDEFNFFSNKNRNNNRQTQNANSSLLDGYIIDEKGMIEFPVVGHIRVEGLTVLEARDKIKSVAEKYLESAVVEVRLLNFRFTLLGEVEQPGTYTSLNTHVTFMEAIGLSGGFLDLADRANVKVVRQNGSVADVYYINLLEEEFLASNKYYMHQNDLIIVPPLKQRPFRRYFGTNLSLFISTLTLTILLIDQITR